MKVNPRRFPMAMRQWRVVVARAFRAGSLGPALPGRVFGILLMASTLLVSVIVLLPSGRLELGDHLTFHFVSQESLLLSNRPEYANIQAILAVARYQEAAEGATRPEDAPDVTDFAHAPTLPPPVPAESEELAQSLEPIQFGEALAPFFSALKESPAHPGPLRILHYGDSQLEGDRISDYLRSRFQTEYGGCGPGLVALYEATPMRLSVKQEATGDWRHYVPFSWQDKSLTHNRFGVMATLYRYSDWSPSEERVRRAEAPPETEPAEEGRPKPGRPAGTPPRDPAAPAPEEVRAVATAAPQVEAGRQEESSLGRDLEEAHGPFDASVTVMPSKRTYATGQRFEVVRLLVGEVANEVDYWLTSDGGETFSGTLGVSPDLGLKTWRLKQPFATLKMFLKSPLSPDLYGLALDCANGIAVDNIPLRGSSGVFVHRVDMDSFRRQARRLNVGLIVWQFGINVVPHLEDNYGLYERQLYRSLSRLREALPEVAVLVVGVSDMSTKEGGDYYRSFPNIAGIRDAQRRAAERAGCAFWDLYQAMGGHNSMPSWVEANLGAKDFVHFTGKGAKIVARMLYNALADARAGWAEEATHEAKTETREDPSPLAVDG